MDLGFALPTSGAWATPENIAEIAQAADNRGYRTLWTFHRVLFPTASRTAMVYRSVLDPLISLGYAAALTTRVRIAMAVVNGPFFAPAVLAKQLATLDVLSGGRLDAGIGLGWSAEEYAAAGVPMEHRGRRFDDWLDCLHAVLTNDPVSYEGEFYQVPSSNVGPMPVQRPRPPLLLGGTAPPALRRAGARGDGWISSSRFTFDQIRMAVVAVRDAAERAGKARTDVRCVVRGTTLLRDPAVAGSGRAPLRGSLAQIHHDISRFADIGVDELFLDLNFDSELVGNPDADPTRAMAMAMAVLAECAPLS